MGFIFPDQNTNRFHRCLNRGLRIMNQWIIQTGFFTFLICHGQEHGTTTDS